MTKPFDLLRERVSRIEADRARDGMRYLAPSRRQDERISRAATRAGRETVTIRLPGLTARPTVQTVTSHSWSTSYATGGEAIAVSALVPDLLAVSALPAAGYTFAYDSGSGKLKAYSAAGTEVAATTNLQAAVGTTTLVVIGRAPTVLDGWTADDAVSLVSASVRFGETVTRSSTNYWTIHAAIRAVGEEFGRKIGNRINTDSRGVTGGAENVLFDAPGGESVAAGSTVVLSATAATAATACLGDAVLTLVIQRKVT